MATLITSATYKTNSPVLQYPDDWQAWSHTFTLTEDEALTVTEDSRKIIKAGTFYPANDHTCQGIVMNDVDVTDGEAAGAILFAGSINENKLPEAPTGDAKYALPRVTYFPTVTYSPTVTTTAYTLPEATADTLGGIRIGAGLTVQDGKLTTETEARTFANPQTLTQSDNILQAANGVYRVNGQIPTNVPTGTNDTAGAIVWDCGGTNKTVIMSDGAYSNALYFANAADGTWHKLSDSVATTTTNGLMSATDKTKLDGFKVQAFGESIGRLTNTATLADDATVSAAEYNTLATAHNNLLAEFNRLISGLEASGYITRPTA